MGSQRVSKHQKCAPLGVCVQVRPTCVDHWKQLEQTTARWCLLIDICWFTSPRKSSSVYHGISTITPTVNLLHQIPMRFRFDLSIFPNQSSHKSQMLMAKSINKSPVKMSASSLAVSLGHQIHPARATNRARPDGDFMGSPSTDRGISRIQDEFTLTKDSWDLVGI